MAGSTGSHFEQAQCLRYKEYEQEDNTTAEVLDRAGRD